MNTNELIDAVIRWGRMHHIDNSNKQFVKFSEEAGEIAHAMTHANSTEDDMVDALGDTMITLIILADTLGYDIRDCLEEAYQVVAKRKGQTIDGCFVKDE